jgi:predicted esterase
MKKLSVARGVASQAVWAALFSWSASAQPVPPKITPTASLQHQAADIGTRASFAVTASGTAPLTYQWRREGHDLAGQTNRTLSFSAVQPADEGDYTVMVTNLAGVVTSEPVRLWVTPRASSFVKADSTNEVGRLPYFYLLPANYDPTRSYPLVLLFHGLGDENCVTNAGSCGPGYLNYPALKTMASYRQQEQNPVIELWPSKRVGDTFWTDAYLRQVSDLLDQFISQFNVDTNRIYLVGGAEGVHAAWDLMAIRPGFFAGAVLAAGWQGNSPAASIKDVPIWAWCAKNDGSGQLSSAQQAVRAFREAGGRVRYTEYATGAYADTFGFSDGSHIGGILMGSATPTIVDWLLAQRRGVPSTAEPLLTITNPTAQAVWLTGATNLNLAGSAAALDQNVTRVAWENTANKLTGVAEGSNAWNVVGIPLVASKTNVVVVTGTTTSWAPACGGSTTFSQTLMAVCSQIRATLALQGTGALLDWTGGSPPYRVQRATDLLTADWTEVLSDATPPLVLPVTGPGGFYRIVGQ